MKAIAYAETLLYTQQLPIFIAEMLENKDSQKILNNEKFLEAAQSAAKLVPDIESPNTIKTLVNKRLKELVQQVTYPSESSTIPSRDSLGCALDFHKWLLAVGERPGGEKFTEEDVFNVLDETDIPISRILV